MWPHCTVIFLKITSMQLYLRMVSINYWNLIKIISAVFENITYWSPSEGPLFVELECTHSSGTNLWWINSEVLNMNTVRSPIKVVPYLQTHRWNRKKHFFVMELKDMLIWSFRYSLFFSPWEICYFHIVTDYFH